MNYKELEYELQDLYDNLADLETGEINLEVEAKIEELEQNREERIAKTIYRLRQEEELVKWLKAEKKRIDELIKRKERNNSFFHQYLYDKVGSIFQYQDIKSGQKKPTYSTQITDESLIADKYCTIVQRPDELKIDKTAIKKDIQAGLEVEGAYLKETRKIKL